MSQQVLHLDFIKLNPETAPERRSQLEAAAAELREIDGVLGVGVIDGDEASDYDVAFWFLLRAFTALEPFGTHPRYIRFLQGTVAPLLRGFAGADVKLDEDLETQNGHAACLALIGPEETYDFEVREALQAWSQEGDASAAAIGLAVGERQAYRGVALAFGVDGIEKPDSESFRSTLIRGTARTLA